MSTHPLSGSTYLIKSPVHIQMSSLWSLSHEQSPHTTDYNRRLLKLGCKSHYWSVFENISVFLFWCRNHARSGTLGQPGHVNR